MRIFLTLSLAALPLIAPHALEAVAQSPVGGGSGGGAENLATQGSLTALQAQNLALGQMITTQQQQLNHFIDCARNDPPSIWNGQTCTTTTGEKTADVAIPSCGEGESLGSKDGKLVCVSNAYGEGTWAGYCSHGWGAVDQIGATIRPAYYDSTPTTGSPAENENATAHGWIIKKGCSCPSGWSLKATGTCNSGYCADPSHGGSITGSLVMYTCIKIAE